MPLLTKQAVIRQLLVYADAFPEASDSAIGIARWWLDPAEAVDMQVLVDALEFLTAEGVFAQAVGADGRRRWRRVARTAHLRRVLARYGQQGD